MWPSWFKSIDKIIVALGVFIINFRILIVVTICTVAIAMSKSIAITIEENNGESELRKEHFDYISVLKSSFFDGNI